jgi:predicted dehydrogenase
MKVGIVGLGARIAHIANHLKQSKPDIVYTAYADPSPAALDNLQQNTGDKPQGYVELADMLRGEKLDMLLVGSPNTLHLEHIRLALEADIPYIFTEKPVVVNEEHSYELLKVMKKHDGQQRIMVGMVLRYSPLYTKVKQAQLAGQLGKIVSIEASEHIAPYHGSFFMRDWRRYSAYSGGFMLEKCCHDLDLYQGVVGCRPRYLSSFGGRKSFVSENQPEQHTFFEAAHPDNYKIEHRINPFNPRWQGSNSDYNSDGDIIDYQVANIEYQDGACMAFHTNMNVPDEYRHFTIVGTHGMAEGDFMRNHLKVTDAMTSKTLLDIQAITESSSNHYGADDSMTRDIAAFIDHGTPLKVTVQDALEAGLTAIKLDDARKNRQVIDLKEVWEKFDSLN